MRAWGCTLRPVPGPGKGLSSKFGRLATSQSPFSCKECVNARRFLLPHLIDGPVAVRFADPRICPVPGWSGDVCAGNRMCGGAAGPARGVWTVDYRGRATEAVPPAKIDSARAVPVVRLASSGRLTPGGAVGTGVGGVPAARTVARTAGDPDERRGANGVFRVELVGRRGRRTDDMFLPRLGNPAFPTQRRLAVVGATVLRAGRGICGEFVPRGTIAPCQWPAAGRCADPGRTVRMPGVIFACGGTGTGRRRGRTPTCADGCPAAPAQGSAGSRPCTVSVAAGTTRAGGLPNGRDRGRALSAAGRGRLPRGRRAMRVSWCAG